MEDNVAIQEQDLKALKIGDPLLLSSFKKVNSNYCRIYPNRKPLEFPKSAKVTKPIYTFIQGVILWK